MSRESYNPRESDKASPFYTTLHEFSGRLDLQMILTDDAYMQNGFILYDVNGMSNVLDISVYDQVVCGNRFGIVEELLYNRKLVEVEGEGDVDEDEAYEDGTDVIGFVMRESLPYSKLSSERSVSRCYLFIDGDLSNWKYKGSRLPHFMNGGVDGLYNLYRGSLKVLRVPKTSESTWTPIQRAAKHYQDKFTD